MAEKSRKSGESITYASIQEVTNISPNTLSLLAQGKVKMVGITTIERLLDYFDCDVGELMVYE
jgi:DNA-binding Xre family transcriptional regulator